MKLRTLSVLATLVLTPALGRAQTGGGTPPPRFLPVALSQAALSRLIPLVQEEGGATSAFWWDQRSARGMTKQEYVALKNTLFIARLDSENTARVAALPFDDGSRATRQANATLYRANKAKLDAALAKVHSDGCGPACSASSPPPAKSSR